MDLRVVKTKKVIKEAFLELRKKTPLEKVKVRDICRIALINKSTFYNHYEDVFALSEELENETVENGLADFKYKDCLLTNPKLFLENITAHLEKNKDMVKILFDGRFEVLYIKMENILRRLYPARNSKEDIMLTFIIGGVMQTMQLFAYEEKYDNETVAKNLSEMIKRLV